MATPKILVFSGSVRTGSHNARLAAIAAKQLSLAGADVTLISLVDYPMPLYDADILAKSGVPEHGIKLHHLMGRHKGVFIASPEYNASVTPLLKNTIDWVSRVRDPFQSGRMVFQDRIFALGAASTGFYGGIRSLMALRQILEIGCKAIVIPEQVTVFKAEEAFDDMDNLKDERSVATLQATVRRLIEAARTLA